MNISKIVKCLVVTVIAVSCLTGDLFAAAIDSSRSTDRSDSLNSRQTSGWFVIETHHRVYTSFLQVDSVKFGQPFELGEGDFTAEIIRFNPDLGITQSGKVLQMSDTLYNPAARIRVTSKGKTTQESWAFYSGGAPHYTRDNVFAFRMLEFKVDSNYIAPPESEPEKK